MIKTLKWCCALMFVCLASLPANAQERITVKGVVSDAETGEALIGVAVYVEEEPSVGATTGIDGDFAIKVKKGNSLVFSYIGMDDKVVKVTSNQLNVKMESSSIEIESVVAIGYGTVSKKELTGATIQLKSEDLEGVVSSDIGMALQGQVPGLSISASAGDPGSVANIQIRGVTSLSGSNTPLFVVDGIPQEDNPNISSNEIASIDILKDAASASIYGSRGAAGVILITTKEGKQGKMKVAFDATYGVQSIATDRLPDLMNTAEQTYFQILANRRDGYTDMESPSYTLTKNEYYYMNDTDALDLIMRDEAASEQSYNLTLSGGSKELTYSLVLGHYDQTGVVRNSEYQRYNMRSNLVYNKDKVKLTYSTAFTLDEVNLAPGTSISQVVSFMPYTPEVATDATEYEVAGTGYSSEVSAVSTLLRSFQATDVNQRTTFATNMALDYKINNFLTASGKASANVYDTNREIFYPSITITDSVGEVQYEGLSNSYVKNTATRRLSYNVSGGLTYNRTYAKKHKLTGTAMLSYEKYDYSGFYAQKYGVIDNDISVLAGTSENPSVGSETSYVNTLVGVIGRVLYSYQSRYMLSLSMRADGSSKFAEGNRWGVFPSSSVGWNVHQEKFWRPLKNTINNFKVRASYGTTGNQSIGAYNYTSTLETGYDYVDGSGSQVVGVAQTTYVDPDIKWETTTQFNAGFDMGFFNNSISISADYYKSLKYDMLSTVQLPASTGVGTSSDALLVKNIGNMTNEGIEFDIRFKKMIGKTFVTANFNIARTINEVTSLGDGNTIIYNSASTIISGDGESVTTVFAEGYEAGAFFLYKTDGVINDQAELEEYQNRTVNGESVVYHPDAQIGDLKFVDTDGDGVLTDSDRAYCGSGTPDFEFGFGGSISRGSWELSTQWFASIGSEIINGVEALSYSEGRNVGLLSQWSETNTTSEIPIYRNSGKEHMNYFGATDLWVEDGSYLRMKVIMLSYTLPEKFTNKVGASSFKVFLTGQNLLTFTGYTGMDPEVGGNGLTTKGLDKGTYPVGKKYMAGVKINF